MDAFFAAVEQRDFPQYRGKPLIVGGSPEHRGVVSTCSYEARKFGIHSAMPSYLAHQLCPNGIFVPGRFEVYAEVSRHLMSIFHSFTPLVEGLSFDEAYLDLTNSTKSLNEAVYLARKIKNRIKSELNLTASAGISYNKFLAKLASDMDKPDGLTLITEKDAPLILDQLNIRKIYGIGKATEQKLLKLGINTGSDLRKMSPVELSRLFGKNGIFYYEIIRGIDERPVIPHSIRKSVGKETTFSADIFDLAELNKELEHLAKDLAARLKEKNLKGKTITLKLKYGDFTLKSRSVTHHNFIHRKAEIALITKQLLAMNYTPKKGVRLLGISISNLNNIPKEQSQLYFDFFDSK